MITSSHTFSSFLSLFKMWNNCFQFSLLSKSETLFSCQAFIEESFIWDRVKSLWVHQCGCPAANRSCRCINQNYLPSLLILMSYTATHVLFWSQAAFLFFLEEVATWFTFIFALTCICFSYCLSNSVVFSELVLGWISIIKNLDFWIHSLTMLFWHFLW